MDNSGYGGSSFASVKGLFVSAAAAAGVGCLALYAWKQWWPCDDEAALNEHGSTYRPGYPSNSRSMGQNQSINLARPFIGYDPAYSPVENGQDEWSITVNPHEEAEMQKLIQRKVPETVGVGASAKEQRPRFKRVLFRSNVADEEETGADGDSSSSAVADETAVVTNQPRSISSPVVVTNLRLADKLKGFSNEEYQNTLQGTLNRLYGATKLLTVDEAKCLTLLLQQRTSDTLLKTLTAMSNLAAFTMNQDLLRENGVIDLLIDLLHDQSLSDSTQVMLVQCVGNMAVNQTNNRLLQCCVPRIVQHLLAPDSSELQRIMCVQALTNLSVDGSVCNGNDFVPILPVLYQRLWSLRGVNIAPLKLLVNLSCMADLVPFMLASEVSVDLLQLVDDSSISRDVLIRATTFLFYLASTVDTLSVSEEEIESKTSHVDSTVFYRLFTGDGLHRFRDAVEQLKQDNDEEIRERSERIGKHLDSIQTNRVDNGNDQ